jgi:nitrogen regulatory protein PII
MKGLKAFVRRNRADQVIGALQKVGAPGITVSRVHGVGYGYDPLVFSLAPSESKTAPEVAQIEVVCRDDQVDLLVTAILQTAHTGSPGDGIVFVTSVERAINIRTGDIEPRSLEP